MVISFTTIRSLMKSGTGLKPLTPASTMRPPVRDVVQRLGDRLGRVGRHLDDDVGAAPVGELRTRARASSCSTSMT